MVRAVQLVQSLGDALLPDYLKPWAMILNDQWPGNAGPLPDANAVTKAQSFGAQPGTKKALAWAMFCRPDGASRAEINAGCGAPQFVAARNAQRDGKLEFAIVKTENRGNVYYMGAPGSHPGGPEGVPAGDTKIDDEEPSDEEYEAASFPKNLILYGAPGTGKTFATIELTLEILDPAYLQINRSARKALKSRFDALSEAGQIRFVTFHQSFSYEDFVEGLRADRDEHGQLQYVVADGVFKSLCTSAAVKVTRKADAPVDFSQRRVWKMSLGNTLGPDAYIYDECIENNYVLLGYGGDTDFSGCTSREEVFDKFISVGKTPEKDSYAVTAVSNFLLKMKVGDILIISEGNSKFRAIGEITSDYRRLARTSEGDDKYGQCRAVKWLRVYSPSLQNEQLMYNQFSQMTLYELKPSSVDMTKLSGLLSSSTANVRLKDEAAVFQIGERFGTGYEVFYSSPDIVELVKPNGKHLPIGMSLISTLAKYIRQQKLTLADIKAKRVFEMVPETLLEPQLVNSYENLLPALVERYLKIMDDGSDHRTEKVQDAKVLIIDEINRGSVSRIFGELITLIEPSKRAGAAEALEVSLPYSKDKFSVPSNLYIIGTMNTADRSLTGLDVALRRRFVFTEMLPKPELLSDINVLGVDVGRLLSTLNDRIEALLDRDHRLGHAYFLPLREERTLDRLASIFRQQIVPLLQEYFFDDWSRIQLVLNDHRKLDANRFLTQPKNDLVALFGEQSLVSDRNERWAINEDAFNRIEAYLGIIDHQTPALTLGDERQAVHGDLTIKRLASGTIEVWKGGERLEAAKPSLRNIAKTFELEINYPSGVSLNTRHLGNRVIAAIEKSKS
jgi:5-methylcytosine-specific restriction enzyme B